MAALLPGANEIRGSQSHDTLASTLAATPCWGAISADSYYFVQFMVIKTDLSRTADSTYPYHR